LTPLSRAASECMSTSRPAWVSVRPSARGIGIVCACAVLAAAASLCVQVA
jgi:hypothetical protein